MAAVTLVTAAADREPSLGIKLLSDLHDIFGQAEQMTTVVILDRLHALSESPWNDLKGRPLNDRGLAYRLREYGVKSRTLNLGGESRAKGYVREDLHDIWRRYLAPPPLSPETSVTSVTSGTDTELQGKKVTDVTGIEHSVTDDGTKKSPEKSEGGTGVTDVTLMAEGRGADDYPELPASLRRPPPCPAPATTAGSNGNGSPPLCDHCGTPGKLTPYDWPHRPFGIALHSSCELPWFDAEGGRQQ